MDDFIDYMRDKLYPFIKPYSVAVGIIWIVKTLLLVFRAAYRGFKLFIWPYIRKLDLIKLYGEYVIITSASDGIGFEFAKQFLKRGHSVVLVDKNADDLNRAKEELQKNVKEGKTIITVVVDTHNNNFNVFQNIGKQLEGIKSNVGILINNANISVKKHDEYLAYTDEQVIDTVRANIISVLMVTKAVLPFMVENKRGLVLNITSPTGCQPLANSGFFNATKEFVDFFGKTLLAEYSRKNITVQTLNPGFVSDGFSAVAKCCFCCRCFFPTPQRFVSSAISTLGRGEQTSGYWGHAVLAVVLRLVPNWLHSSVYWVYNKFSGSGGGGSGGNQNGSAAQEANEMLTVVSDITKRDN